MITPGRGFSSICFGKPMTKMIDFRRQSKNSLLSFRLISAINTDTSVSTILKRDEFGRMKFTSGSLSANVRNIQMTKAKSCIRRFISTINVNAMNNKRKNHPVRSVMFTPGINERALTKGRNIDCDVLVMDLEDAVTAEKKAEAREITMRMVEEGGYGDKLIAVRANGVGTPWMKDDIAAIAASKADILIIPKVSSPDTLFMINELLVKYQARRTLGVWAMIETAKAVMSVKDIACSGMRQLECLLLGNADLTKDLNARHTVDRIALTYALSKCVVAARAYGLKVVDGVHLDIHNEETFRSTARQGRDLGFDGKSLLHPKDVKVCNEIFGTTDEEAEKALKIIDAFSKAKSEGKGVVVVDGKLVENLHVEEAYKALAMYEYDKQKGV